MENQITEQTGDFVAPRHWIAPEELSPAYWSDSARLEKRGQEFHDKPIETIALIDKFDSKGIARRDFLTLMGASMAMASLACARRPVHKIIPYVVRPEEIIPGVPNFYASTDPETGYGLLVKTREGRPIKLEGNPEHPLNRGKLHARGQAALLELYDPERLQEPVTRQRGQTASLPAKWPDVDAAVVAQLKKAASSGGHVRILTGQILSDSTRKLIAEFISGFGAGAHIEFEPLALDEIVEAQTESYGTAVVPSYRFDQADVVLSFGADYLGTWLSPVEHARDWMEKRRLDSSQSAQATLSKLITFEPTMTITGAKSDERYPVRAGDELKIALAIAHELIVVKGRSHFASDGSVRTALEGYSLKVVAQDVGIEESKLSQVAESLWSARGKGMVVAGGLASKTENAVALQMVVNLLNSALENEGATVDGSTRARAGVAGPSFAKLQRLITDMNSGAVDVLILHRVNPAYTLSPAVGFLEAAKKVPFIVSIADRDDETAQLADIVVPDFHPLESWGDAQVRRGLYSLQQPTIAPLFSSRGLQDCLIAWAKGAELRSSGSLVKVATWHDYLVDYWKSSVYRDVGATGPFEAFWENSLRDGFVQSKSLGQGRASARTFKSASLSRVPRFKAAGAELVLSLYPTIGIYDGRGANNPWLQEMPEPISTVTWDNFLNVGPALAKKLDLKQNDVVEVRSGNNSVELPVVIQPGMHPQAVSTQIGYGRRNSGKVGTGVGVDVYPFAQVIQGRLVYSGMATQIRKTGRVYRLAETQWHNATENRPIINDITLAEFKENPAEANETDPELRLKSVPSMWPRHEYTGYRWGMAIDLNACTGCNACVIGCQSENNIPVVGRDNVRKGREMHWIRIDRYYSGNPDQPTVLFQPMLCQHCENAPCETVCPVLATVHDSEGTNNQIYNRCVGTRYCQNNCPYKVRRFNFFDHWKSYESTMNLAWNPDVTVRSRGIMEKCTFCIQRVEKARHNAKNKGEKIQEADLQTACMQTCPTDAIVFGDMNNPNSRVSKLKADARAFRSLEVLNTRPSISYLTHVRNVEVAHEGGKKHEKKPGNSTEQGAESAEQGKG